MANQTTLQNWKKTPRLDSKGCPDDASDVLASIIMEAPTNEIKEMLIKIKIDASYDANSKILQSHEVKLVQETLKYLEVGGEGLTKEGVILANSLEYPERIHRGLEWTQLLKRLIVCLFSVLCQQIFSFFLLSFFSFYTVQYRRVQYSTVIYL